VCKKGVEKEERVGKACCEEVSSTQKKKARKGAVLGPTRRGIARDWHVRKEEGVGSFFYLFKIPFS